MAIVTSQILFGTAATADTCTVSNHEAPALLAPGTISNTGDEVFRGVFNPDGSEFYFFRSLGPNENYGIFKSTKGDLDVWGKAERVILGSAYSDLYPTISPSGNEMIFVSYRPATKEAQEKPSANIWSSKIEIGTWGQPTLLGVLSNSQNYDNRPLFRANGNIGFSSTSPDWRATHEYVAVRNGVEFSPPAIDEAREQFREWAENKPALFVWTSDLSPSGETAIIEVSSVGANDRPGPADLWISNKDQNSWTEPTPLSPLINTKEGNENFPTFSDDGKTLVFVRDFKSFYSVRLTCK